jgi:hypothetical protein
MIMNAKFAGLAAAAVLFSGVAATTAGAVTVVSNGGAYDVGSGLETQFIGDVMGSSGGAGMYQVTFNSTSAGSAEARVTIGEIVASTFADLTMSWVGGDGTVSTDVSPVVTSLGTLFVDPDALSKTLVFAWSDSLIASGFDFEVEISPIPVPAAGLLLLTGIAGLGALRSRRKASAEA